MTEHFDFDSLRSEMLGDALDDLADAEMDLNAANLDRAVAQVLTAEATTRAALREANQRMVSAQLEAIQAMFKIIEQQELLINLEND